MILNFKALHSKNKMVITKVGDLWACERVKHDTKAKGGTSFSKRFPYKSSMWLKNPGLTIISIYQYGDFFWGLT